MAEFLVEAYLARGNMVTAEQALRVRQAAEEVSHAGTPVRYLFSIYVPDDETCFYLYQAESAEVVRGVAQRAGLQFARVIEAVTDPPADTTHDAG